MFKAVITDLDGSLLDKDHNLTLRTKEVVNELVNKGYKFYIATGRLYKGAKDIMDKLGVKVDIVCLNGSRVTDSMGNEIFSKKLDKKDNDYLVNFDYKKYGDEIFVNGYIADEWYVVGDEYKWYYENDRKDKPYHPTPVSEEEFKKQHYNKMYFIGEHENLLLIQEELKKANLNINISFVSEKCLEFYHKECDKITGAKYLLERDNIKLEECISFGDGINDIELITKTGRGYMMGNAIYLLKEIINRDYPHIEMIGDSNDNSVAEKIKEVFKLEV